VDEQKGMARDFQFIIIIFFLLTPTGLNGPQNRTNKDIKLAKNTVNTTGLVRQEAE